MVLVLTGSGPALDPAPGCGCARCRRAAAHEPRRKGFSLDLGPGKRLDFRHPPAVVRDGRTMLLWAPGGRLPDVRSLGQMDVAFFTPADDDRSLGALGHAIGAARAAGTIGPRTRIVLAGLTHDHPGPARLAPLLTAWGVHRPDDGTDLEQLAPLPRLTGRTLVLGGASSGKSAFAELLLAAEPEVAYLATGPKPDAADEDWTARVRTHRERRPDRWRTIETPDAAVIFGTESAVLLDAVGTWLTAALDDVEAWEQAPGWRRRLAVRTDELVAAWRARAAPLVAVTDEVGLGVVPATPAGRIFREELGRLNARLAEESDRVVLVVAGHATDIMGS